MMRSARGRGELARIARPLGVQARELRYSTLQDSLKPIAGQTAGTLNVMNEICINPDSDEERKRPAWRLEVPPKRAEHNRVATYWKWGYNSLSLFCKVNEDPGPWWNANNSTLTCNWSQIGEYCCAGLWSGVWRYTYGVGQFNLRPSDALKRAWGRRDANGALTLSYDETHTKPTEKLVFPHTKEHAVHKRDRNPALPGFGTIDAVHGKRVLRELQFHLSNGLRYYMVDGYFGSNPSTSTPFRIITDNPTHAYWASFSAIRQSNVVNIQEVVLQKRLTVTPLDEWAWRRPGVLVLHAAGYDFEVPRIVEEFGGPRPQDLGLTQPKFVVLDPYSIPMKGLVGGDPACGTLRDATAFLCARWGFYADGKAHVTLGADSVLSADGASLTVVVHNGRVDANALRQSPRLYGAHHHRIADGVVARAWDSTTLAAPSSKTRPLDFVESSLGLVQRPLPLHVGGGLAHSSHRFYNRRNVAEFGYKRPHNYICHPEHAAAAAGHLFGKPSTPAEATVPRPRGVRVANTTFVVVTDGASPLAKADAKKAAAEAVEGLARSSWLYADADKLTAAVAAAFEGAASVVTVGAQNAAAVLDTLAQKGQL